MPTLNKKNFSGGGVAFVVPQVVVGNGNRDEKIRMNDGKKKKKNFSDLGTTNYYFRADYPQNFHLDANSDQRRKKNGYGAKLTFVVGDNKDVADVAAAAVYTRRREMMS